MIPFAKIVKYGNTASDTDRYVGLVPELSYTAIRTVLNPTTVINQHANFKCYEFKVGGKSIILPSQAFGIDSYKTIYERGMVYGTDDIGPIGSVTVVTPTVQNATITIRGELYRVRLMVGSHDNISLLSNNPKLDPPTEWENYIYSIYNDVPNSLVGAYTIPFGDRIPWVQYYTTSTRRWALVQGSDGGATPRCIGRGRFDIVNTSGDGEYAYSQFCSTSISPLWTAAQNLWWPIFEKI